MDSDTLALLYFIVILLIMVNGSRAAAPKGTIFCRNCQFSRQPKFGSEKLLRLTKGLPRGSGRSLGGLMGL